MKRYQITFTDADTEPQTWHCSAYDADHAADKFRESWDSEGGAEGVEIASIHQLRTIAAKIKTFYRP